MSISLFLLAFSAAAVTTDANAHIETGKGYFTNGQHDRYWNNPSTRTFYGNYDGRRTVLNPYDYSTARYSPDYWRRHNYDYDYNSLNNRWNTDYYNDWYARDGRYHPRTQDSWYFNNRYNRNRDYNYSRWNDYNNGRWNTDGYKYYNSYPRFSYGNSYSRNLANTGFQCPDLAVGGYYADVNSGCQVYYICQEDGRQSSFLCSNGTLFNQKLLTCDHWYNVDCGSSPSYYYLNDRVRQFPRLPTTLNRYK